ncbi:GumC family protein [Seonamhaeicola maritimus]|uniref:Polysaccharide chain length determinant N-terminal domain-containing protein n=1 Tax=Seonamhaeicola maritimus TaxID=2591822 RepID=A0A5C7GF83_9FLAO|nr:hypothetical protein [Seonamhaeicola maritimus]TXG35328.1 hypothetical protein FUA22_16400 [Seonamhaeicola maritimus]
MKLIDFIKLILKHKVILVFVPLLIGSLAILLTSNPNHKYYSQTMLFTGLASGSSIDMDKSFNYFASNIAFDNLINIINSRETQEEVAVRLLSQHLLLDGPDDRFISSKNYNELKNEIPQDIYKYVVRSSKTNSENTIPYDYDNGGVKSLPESIDKIDYEQTVSNLMALMNSDNVNFVYSLLNFEHPVYSLETISKVKSIRISNSDLVKISYEADDPGICQQTLAIFNEVCIRKYKDLKENGSDAVVKYFESQLEKSQKNLTAIEERLLKFNQDNSIINYYEQSKAVAIVKEELEVEYSNKRADLAGSEASTRKLEQKLKIQELIQNKNDQILKNKKRLGDLQYKIVMMEAKSLESEERLNDLNSLKKEASNLEEEIESSVSQLYSFQNSVEGVPIKKVLPQWVDQVVETEDLKAKLNVMDTRNKKFEEKYANYAPAGANLKRIEREINVAEEEYLEILHGLNLAKLKYQDTQLSSNLKAVDPPYYPLKPMPSKRKLIIIAVLLVSFIMLLGVILVMEFFDNTLKNIDIAEGKLNIPAMGMLAKLFKTNGLIDLISVQDRLMELSMQNLNHTLKKQKSVNKPMVITIFSMQKDEGKTVIANNIARKLEQSDKTVLFLNHSNIEKQKNNTTKHSLLHKLLGYQDPRNDYNHPFLKASIKETDGIDVTAYNVDKTFYNAKTFEDLNGSMPKKSNQIPDFVIIELPNILEVNYPADLMINSDIALLVCRSNRLWSKADESLLNNVKELTPSKLQFIINGVELNEVEALVGELVKQRSKFRKRIKNILRLQFYSESHI